jgi:hypothetical protein
MIYLKFCFIFGWKFANNKSINILLLAANDPDFADTR